MANSQLNILLDKGEGSSYSANLNYVAKYENIFIVDNHLAAFWCWSQLDLDNQYELLHVDQHYDCSQCYGECLDTIKAVDWKTLSIELITDIKFQDGGFQRQLLLWDNYICCFLKYKPGFFRKATFITHGEGEFEYPDKYEEGKFENLTYLEVKREDNVILNFDLDIFFYETDDNGCQQIYDDGEISKISKWIRREKENFVQIIICLSPEMCESWNKAKEIANKILQEYQIKI